MPEHSKVLVTGANKGIGYAVVKRLVQQGYNVLLGCRDLEKGQQAASTLEHYPVTPVHIDLSEPDALKQQINAIQANYQITALVNNAAVLVRANVQQLTSQDFYHSMRVNVHGPFDLIKAFLPRMIQQGYGRIVNVSSGWGSFHNGLDGPAAYCVSKAALNALTLTLSHELPANVKVNSMDPGWTQTDMGGQSASRTPEQAAKTIVWLATLPDDGPNGQFFYDKKPVSW